jgi:polysaccharide biosynthesis/export protein
MNPINSPSCCSYSYKILTITGVILPLLLSSCVTQRDLEYMKEKRGSQLSYNEASYTDYQLKSNDALYIQIRSLDDAASNAIFAQSATIQTLDPYSAYLTSYTVDKEGFVQLPVIGKIYVSGKTTAELSDLIKDSVVNILSLPMVTVKLVNRYVSVLGEVRLPGHYIFSQDKFTIYDAISLAGDINIFGNRKEVILVRNENGKNIRIPIDLTQSDLISSPYYFIQPNDFIYVSPLRKRFWGFEQFPWAIIFSTITTALLIYSIVQP